MVTSGARLGSQRQGLSESAKIWSAFRGFSDVTVRLRGPASAPAYRQSEATKHHWGRT